MSLRKQHDDNTHFTDFDYEESPETLSHKRQVRKALEDRLERKRIKEEFDELDGEFDWDEWDK
jgi:hypothetical protein